MYPSGDFTARARMSYRLVDEASRGRARRAAMAVEVAATRRLFTREEWGEIVDAFVNNLNQLLAVRLAGRAIVAVQGPGRRHHPAPPGALQGARGLRGGRAPADRPIDQAQALRRGWDSRVLGR